jgi:hypothetical protein
MMFTLVIDLDLPAEDGVGIGEVNLLPLGSLVKNCSG